MPAVCSWAPQNLYRWKLDTSWREVFLPAEYINTSFLQKSFIIFTWYWRTVHGQVFLPNYRWQMWKMSWNVNRMETRNINKILLKNHFFFIIRLYFSTKMWHLKNNLLFIFLIVLWNQMQIMITLLPDNSHTVENWSTERLKIFCLKIT